MKNRLGLFSIAFLGASTVATAAQAHGASGIGAGFLHPLSGIDHLLALLAVGVLAGRIAGKSTWALPASFLVLMAAGAGVAAFGFFLPGTETVILGSVAILMVLAAMALRLTAGAAAAITGFFALFHGAAHGAEMGAAAPLSFFAGFVAAAVVVMMAGIALGKGIERLRAARTRHA